MSNSGKEGLQVGGQRQREIPERVVAGGRVAADGALDGGAELAGHQVDQRRVVDVLVLLPRLGRASR